VKRGGSWNNNDNNCRVANRNNWNEDSNYNNNVGFRLANTVYCEISNLYGVLNGAENCPGLYPVCESSHRTDTNPRSSISQEKGFGGYFFELELFLSFIKEREE